MRHKSILLNVGFSGQSEFFFFKKRRQLVKPRVGVSPSILSSSATLRGTELGEGRRHLFFVCLFVRFSSPLCFEYKKSGLFMHVDSKNYISLFKNGAKRIRPTASFTSA